MNNLKNEWIKDYNMIPIGTKILYNVYPEGENIEGVIVLDEDLENNTNKKIKQIKTIGSWAKNFKSQNVSIFVNFKNVEIVKFENAN